MFSVFLWWIACLVRRLGAVCSENVSSNPACVWMRSHVSVWVHVYKYMCVTVAKLMRVCVCVCICVCESSILYITVCILFVCLPLSDHVWLSLWSCLCVSVRVCLGVCECACMPLLFKWWQPRLPLFTHLSPLVPKRDQKEHCLEREGCACVHVCVFVNVRVFCIGICVCFVCVSLSSCSQGSGCQWNN